MPAGGGGEEVGRKTGKDGAAGAGRAEGGRASRGDRAIRQARGKPATQDGQEPLCLQERRQEKFRETRPPEVMEAWATPQAENAIRTRNLARFMLHGFALQVQGGQRSSAYSLQECLDDVESMMETLVHSLSGICREPD